MSELFVSSGQSIGASISVSVLPMNIQGWFPLGLTVSISWQSKALSRIFSNTTFQKHQFFSAASQLVLVVKDLPANAGDIRDAVSIPGLGRSPGEGTDNPLQYSCLGNPMDRRAWRTTVQGVTKESDTTERLNNTWNELKKCRFYTHPSFARDPTFEPSSNPPGLGHTVFEGATVSPFA